MQTFEHTGPVLLTLSKSKAQMHQDVRAWKVSWEWMQLYKYAGPGFLALTAALHATTCLLKISIARLLSPAALAVLER